MTDRIRLIGQTHATHADGAILSVTDNPAIAVHNTSTVGRSHAEALVEKGQAEWVSPPEGPSKEGGVDRVLDRVRDLRKSYRPKTPPDE